ncbi:MAG: hypothetical protein RL662_2421 [Bacteroidota bacterium]|jgi:hypothetical protein
MGEKEESMANAAMNYAIPLGLFWVFKYLFVILGDYNDLGKYLNSLLTIGTPIVFYILLCKYRDVNLGGQISYGKTILFSLLMFAFASFIELAIISLHIFVINPAFLSLFREQVLEIADKMNFGGQGYKEQIRVLASNMGAYYISTWLLMNLFIGLFLSLILGYFVSKPKSDQLKNN